MPEITIIVPVYQAEPYLPACIDSILSQTFRDFQLILVDDGSPDDCGRICEEYAARDNRILVLHQENQGQAAARNHALQYAQGKYLCFVDSDDQIHPQMVELLYSGLKDGAISMCRMLEAAELPENFLKDRTTSFRGLTMEEGTLAAMFDKGDYPAWVACAKLIPRELVDDYPFCPGRVYEDNEAVCHWVCQGKTLAVTDEMLYFYRTNPHSTTQSEFSLKKLDYLWALERIVRYYRELGYEAMVERFCGLYAEAAADSYRWVQQVLKRQDKAKELRRSVRGLFYRERFPLTKAQFEMLLDAMHPKLIRIYWPMEAGIRTLREAGLKGLLRKAADQLRKGDQP